MKKRMIILGVITIFIVGLILFLTLHKEEKLVNNITKECTVDSDCVKDSCCHASGCVAISKEAKCSGVICSQECAPGTLDCGQASCKCVNNKCGVSLNG